MKKITLSLIAGLMALNTNLTFAQAGTLDSSFSGDGRVTTTTNNSTHSSYGESVAIQTNGKIVVAGYETYDVPGFSFTPAYLLNRFLLVKYNSSGSLDINFGGGDGIVTTNFSNSAEAKSVAIQNWDQKIVVAGSTNGKFALVRYTSNGIPDNTFGVNGIVTTSFGNSAEAKSVAINQSNHSIVVAGSSNSDFAVARYTSNGTLDNTFSGDGKKTIGFGSGTADACYSVAIQSDGKIVLAGTSGNDFAVARLTTSGLSDNTFGGLLGIVTTSFGLYDNGYSVKIQADGKIVVAGNSRLLTFSSVDFAVARYNSNGTLDNTFSGDGKVTTDFLSGYNDFGTSVAIESAGKIVVAGYSKSSDGSIVDFAVARYTSTGILDNAFSGDGKVTTPFSFGTLDEGRSIAIQSNGRIVVAGVSLPLNDDDYDIAVARYFGTPVRPSLQADASESSALNKVNAGASSGIHLYPNPVTDILHVEGIDPSHITTISITDASGKIIQKATAVNGNYIFNVKMLTPGIYYITIVENKKITNLKFIKQ